MIVLTLLQLPFYITYRSVNGGNFYGLHTGIQTHLKGLPCPVVSRMKNLLQRQRVQNMDKKALKHKNAQSVHSWQEKNSMTKSGIEPNISSVGNDVTITPSGWTRLLLTQQNRSLLHPRQNVAHCRPDTFQSLTISSIADYVGRQTDLRLVLALRIAGCCSILYMELVGFINSISSRLFIVLGTFWKLTAWKTMSSRALTYCDNVC